MHFICMCDISCYHYFFYVNICIYVLCVNSYFTEGHKVDKLLELSVPPSIKIVKLIE